MISECPTALLNYKNIFEKDVEWGDMDAMQHVNNKRYFYYAESARLRWFNEIYSQLGVEYGGELKESFALAETSCKFKVPLTFY
jgi:acyl-CoA thioesterase FadM